MATKTVGCHARVAGVWEPCKPNQFTVWWNDPTEKVHAYAASAWQVAATDLIRGLSTDTSERSIFDFDFNSPFSTQAQLQLHTDGNVKKEQSNAGLFNGDPWLEYKNAHDLWNYGMWFTDDDTHNLDTVPAAPFSSTKAMSSTHIWESARTAAGQEDGRFTVRFNDFDAPGPAQVHLTFGITISIENGSL